MEPNLTLVVIFPLNELKRLHSQLTEFENYLMLSSGGYYLVKDDIDRIYAVQEMIEHMVKDFTREQKRNRIDDEINNLDLNF